MTPPRQKRLRKARKVKLLIDQHLDALASGALNLRDVLEHPEGVLGRCSIHTILCKTPKLGKSGARKVLEKSKVWPMERLSNLDAEQRNAILRNLPPRVANRYPSHEVD